MNLLEIGFGILCVTMLVFGLLINYGNSLPKVVVQLFRYGRANISNTKPSFVRSIEIPKRWFAHFYLFAVVMQLIVCATVLGSYCFGVQFAWLINVLNFLGKSSVTVNRTTTIVGTLLFCFHLSRRLYETLRVSVYSNTKMNLFHYILAYAHYTGAILCVVAHSPNFASNIIPDNSISSFGIMEAVSVLVFFVGNYLQHRAHVGLANLRKGNDKKQSMGHQIPRGELFEYISCPNYFGEIIIYSAMACLFGLRNSSWNSCTLWVISNQITSGIMNHLWYIDTFKDYPKKRKAIIPYVL